MNPVEKFVLAIILALYVANVVQTIWLSRKRVF